jgi:plastocyanin domain-containing protein
MVMLIFTIVVPVGCGQAKVSTAVPVGADGVQSLTLAVTRDGYSPSSFSVKQGIPVKIIFREVTALTCGNEIIFPGDLAKPVLVKLTSPDDQQVVIFTPKKSGVYQFYCPCKCLEHVGTFSVTSS